MKMKNVYPTDAFEEVEACLLKFQKDVQLFDLSQACAIRKHLTLYLTNALRITQLSSTMGAASSKRSCSISTISDGSAILRAYDAVADMLVEVELKVVM